VLSQAGEGVAGAVAEDDFPVVRAAMPSGPDRTACDAVAMLLGKVGIWMPKRFGTAAVAELEALGYGALWLGVSPSVQEAIPFLEAGSSI